MGWKIVIGCQPRGSGEDNKVQKSWISVDTLLQETSFRPREVRS